MISFIRDLLDLFRTVPMPPPLPVDATPKDEEPFLDLPEAPFESDWEHLLFLVHGDEGTARRLADYEWWRNAQLDRDEAVTAARDRLLRDRGLTPS